MEPTSGDELNWTIREFVYDYIVANERPPSVEEAAFALGRPPEAIQAAYTWLHARHALFLDADGRTIRMAHPFSATAADYRVLANGRSYYANCALDMLGIPAALHADALVEARMAGSGEPITLTIQAGHVHGHGEVVHLLVPFRHWYDDLVFT